jgi:hypothetical protein
MSAEDARPKRVRGPRIGKGAAAERLAGRASKGVTTDVEARKEAILRDLEETIRTSDARRAGESAVDELVRHVQEDAERKIVEAQAERAAELARAAVEEATERVQAAPSEALASAAQGGADVVPAAEVLAQARGEAAVDRIVADAAAAAQARLAKGEVPTVQETIADVAERSRAIAEAVKGDFARRMGETVPGAARYVTSEAGAAGHGEVLAQVRSADFTSTYAVDGRKDFWQVVSDTSGRPHLKLDWPNFRFGDHLPMAQRADVVTMLDAKAKTLFEETRVLEAAQERYGKEPWFAAFRSAALRDMDADLKDFQQDLDIASGRVAGGLTVGGSGIPDAAKWAVRNLEAVRFAGMFPEMDLSVPK